MDANEAAAPDGGPEADPDSGGEDNQDAALVASAGDVTGAHVLVLGHDSPDVLPALIRGGCAAATEPGAAARPEFHTAGVTIIPNVTTLGDAEPAIRNASRALTDAGRIVLRTASSPSSALAQGICRMLRIQGFTHVRLRNIGARTVVCAELPHFGHIAHV